MSEGSLRILRFVLVGAVNTAVDFLLFFGLMALDSPIVLANMFSTSAALGLSFVLNRRFTFRLGTRTRRQLILFLTVTLIGLWGVQPIVILLVATGGESFGIDAAVALLLGKVAATGVTLVWNYVLYARFVFAE